MPADRPATVWASTFVPSKSPLADFGQDGYSVAWIDTVDGRRQVLVSGPRPGPGTTGHLIESTLGDADVELFVADPA